MSNEAVGIRIIITIWCATSLILAVVFGLSNSIIERLEKLGRKP